MRTERFARAIKEADLSATHRECGARREADGQKNSNTIIAAEEALPRGCEF